MSDLMQAPSQSELPPLDGGASEGRSSRLLVLVAVAGGLVVLGLAAFFLFFSGSGEEELGPVPAAPQQQADNGGKKQGEGKQDTVPPVYQDTVGRDPFQPLAAEELVVPEPSAAPTPPADTTGEPPALAPDYYQASLKAIEGTSATIIVNGVAYTVEAGDRFPDTATGPFQLVRIAEDGKSVYIKWGSESYELTFKNGFVGDLG